MRTAAQTFRSNPNLDAAKAIQELMVGEALVSTLDERGAPSVVERTLISPPVSRLGPATAGEIQGALDDSPVLGKYEERLVRDSAHERIQARRQSAAGQPQSAGAADRGGRPRQGLVEAVTKSAARSLGTSLGRQIARTIIRSLFGGRGRR